MLEKRFEIRQEEQKIGRLNKSIQSSQTNQINQPNQSINQTKPANQPNQPDQRKITQGEVCDFGKGWCGWGFRGLRAFVLLFIISLIFLFSTPAFADPGWWNSSWKYRQPINISNTAGNLTNYQVEINLTEAVLNLSGLVGSWHFSEGTGNRTADSSGYGNDGTLTNFSFNADSNWTSGVEGYGLKFDGSDDYVDCGNDESLNITDEITIEAWVKISSLDKYHMIATKAPSDSSSGYELEISNTNKIRFLVGSYPDGDLIGNTILTTNTWYHIVGVYDETNLIVYLNGVNDGNLTWTANPPSNNLNVYIGQRSDLNSNYDFNGTIDEVRIYNRALSAEEIKKSFCIGAYRLYAAGTWTLEKYQSTGCGAYGFAHAYDWRDLRFVDTNNTDLNYWLENDKKVWVKVPTLPGNSDSEIYMYYGNPSASSASDGEAVFEFFDDFEDGVIDTSKWDTSYAGTGISETAGVLRWGDGEDTSTERLVWTQSQISGDVIVEFDRKIYGSMDYYWALSARAESKFAGACHADVGCGNSYYVSSHQNDAHIGESQGETKYWTTSSGNGYGGTADTTFKREKIIVKSYYVRAILKDETVDFDRTMSYYNYDNGYYAIGRTGGTRNMDVDMFRVRKYADPEPTVSSFGEEENRVMVSLISPPDSSYDNDGNVTFICNASSSVDLVNITLYVWNSTGIYNTTTNPVSGTSNQTEFNLTEMPDGNYEWNCLAYDNKSSSDWADSNFSLVIDTTPPIISIISPSNNDYLNSNLITINGTSTDTNLNYTNISIKQGTTIINSTTTTSSSWEVNLSVPDGVYNITATAYDKAGNSNSTTVINITIDATPPTISIISPSNNDYLNSNLITINGTSTDTNLNYTNISIKQGTTIINSTTTTSSSWEVNLSVPDGVYNITATAYDKAGNSNSTTVINITIDATPPVLTWKNPTPANNSYRTESYTEINLTITEPHFDSFKFNWFNGTNWTNSSFYDDSLVLALNFNNNSEIGENSTYVVDISKYGNDGTIVKPSDWWNDSWKYRKKLTITNNNDTNLSISEVINFTLDTATLISEGKLLANGSDLRIVCAGSEVNRTNTTGFNSSNTEIWFKSCVQINAGGNSGNYFYIYYGNPNAGTPGTEGINTSEQKYNLSQSFGAENQIRAQYTTGKFGSALSFDGVDDYVNMGCPAVLQGAMDSSQFTIEFWIKKTGTDSRYIFLRRRSSSDGMFDIYWRDANRVYIETHMNDVRIDLDTPTATSDGNWHHIAITRDTDADEFRSYADGVLITDAVDTRSPFNIGCGVNREFKWMYEDVWDTYTKGMLDEVRIYNRALSAEEIKMHYLSEFQKYNSTEWRFYDNLSVENQTHKFNFWANDTLGWSSTKERIVHTNTISISNLSFEDSETKHEFNVSANATHLSGTFNYCYIHCPQCNPNIKQKTPVNNSGIWTCEAVVNTSGGDLEASVGTNLSFNISFEDSYGKVRYSETKVHQIPNRAPVIEDVSYLNKTDGHGFDITIIVRDPDNVTEELSNCKIHYIAPGSPEVIFDGQLNSTDGGVNVSCTAEITNNSAYVDVGENIEFWAVITDSSGATNTTTHYNNTIINHKPTIQTPATPVYSNEHAFNISAVIDDADSDSLTCKVYLSNGECSCTENGIVSGGTCEYSKVTNGTCGCFNVTDWIDIVVEVADSWSKVNSSEVSQQIPNRPPSKPSDLTLLINDSFNDSTHVVTHHPLINWTNPTDDENDAISITAAVGTSPNPTAEDNTVSSSNNSMTLGHGVTLVDGQTYYFRIKSCDAWDCSSYTTNCTINGTVTSNCSFTMNTPPTIQNAQLNQTSNLTTGTTVHLEANITDEQGDSIVWANWTVWENGQILPSINNTNGTYSNNLYNSPDFNITGGASYNWTLITSDGFETSETSGTFSGENTAPTITQNPEFFDYSGHKFRVNASVYDPDPNDIDSCTVYLDDGESSNTTAGNLTQIDSNNYKCEYNISPETNQNFTVLEQILVYVKFSDGKATATTSTKSHNIPNIAPSEPTNINLTVPNLNRVTDHNPTLEWTKGTDQDGDNVTTYIYVQEGNCSAVNATTEETHTSGNNTTIGNTVSLTDGKTYCLRARSYDSYEYGNYSNEIEFYMNSKPAINSVVTEPEAESINETMEINLTANITDSDTYNFNDTIIWANFTVKLANGTVIIQNKNGTKYEDLWKVNFNVSPSTTYYYNVTAFDGYETQTQSGSFTTNNSNPVASGPYFEDNQARHAFIAWANATDSDGNITSCTIYYGDNSTEVWTGANSSINCSKEINTSHFDVGVSIQIYFVFKDNANATVTTPTLSHQLPNRVPSKPTNINLDVVNSSRVINHNPTLEWTIGEDNDMEDVVITKIYVGTSSPPTTLETEVSGNSTTLGNTVQLADGQTYYYQLCSCDNWSSNCSGVYNFTMNTQPTIQSVQLNNTGTLHGGDVVHLKANITDDQNDSIIWANFTVWTGKGIVNSTEGGLINNLNGTQGGTIWNSSSFKLESGLTYNWNLTTSDSFEISKTSDSFTVANSQPVINQSISFTDLGNHTFKANATVYDADADNIESCTVYLDDGESSNTTAGNLTQIDSNNYLCEYNISPETNQNFTVGEVIKVTITFTDYGGASVSTSDSHQIPNQKPNINAIWITPASPDTTTDLNVIVNASDPENDEISNGTFDWYLNGAKNKTTVDGTLQHQNTKKGENWSVCLQVKDEYNAISDENCSDNVTILNYPPDLSNITVSNYEGHRILVSTIATDYDNETDFKNCTIYYFDENNQGNKTGVMDINYGTNLEAKCSGNISTDSWIIPNQKINVTIEICDGNLSGGSNCTNTTKETTIPNIVPEISLTSPENNANLTNKTIKFTWSGSDSDSDNLTYNLTIYNTESLINETNTTNNSYEINLTDGIYYWNVSVTDLFNGTKLNTTNSETRKLTLDTTPPYLINSTCTINGTENRTEENVTNRTLNVTQGDNITCVLEFRDNSQNWGIDGLKNATLNINYEVKEDEERNLNFTENRTEFNLTNLPAGYIYLNITVFDWLLNNNWTKINLSVKDTESPNITSISHSPTSLGNLDPGENITISAEVTDNLGIDKVLLYYRRNDSLNTTDWNKTEMNLSSGTNRSGTYEVILENWTKGNWTYYVWANDTSGNEINSSEQNLTGLLQVWFDYTISVNITGVPDTAIINQNFTLGIVNFENTGDFNYTCELPNSTDITTSRDMSFYYNSSQVLLENPPLTETREINATGEELGTVDIEIPVDCSCINCTENNTNYTTTITLNPQVKIIAAGPYFEFSGSSKIETVNAGDSIDLWIGIKNIGNESAVNLSVFFSNLPSGFVIKPVEKKESLFSCESGNNYKNYLFTISVSDSVETGSYCFNLITNCSNCAVEQNLKQICIPVEGKPKVEKETTYVGGGGGRGETGAIGLTTEQKKKLMQTEETFEVVRKEQQNFTLTIKNIFDGRMENVKINVSGYLSNYLSLVPDHVDFIPVNGSYNFTVQIIAPKYFTRGTYYLNFTIIATINETTTKNNITRKKITDLKENRLVTLIIHEISKLEAERNLNRSREVLEEFNNLNFYSEDIKKLIKESEEAIENKNYVKTEEIFNKISEIKEKAYLANSGIKEIEQLIKEAEEREIKVEKTKRLLNLAKAAFARGDYATALSRVQEAKLVYAAETKGEFSIGYFIKTNWLKLGVLTGVLILLFIGIFFELKLSRIKSKLKTLKKEENVLIGLMKEAQRECFELKKLSMDEYADTMRHYENRLSKVVSDIISYETKEANLFKIRGTEKALKQERNRLLKLISEMQEAYLEKGKLETMVYLNRLKSYAKRLSEVQEKIATLEAKKEIEKKTRFWYKIRSKLRKEKKEKKRYSLAERFKRWKEKRREIRKKRLEELKEKRKQKEIEKQKQKELKEQRKREELIRQKIEQKRREEIRKIKEKEKLEKLRKEKRKGVSFKDKFRKWIEKRREIRKKRLEELKEKRKQKELEEQKRKEEQEKQKKMIEEEKRKKKELMKEEKLKRERMKALERREKYTKKIKDEFEKERLKKLKKHSLFKRLFGK